jgi:hypothetical protein
MKVGICTLTDPSNRGLCVLFPALDLSSTSSEVVLHTHPVHENEEVVYNVCD